MSGNKNPCPLGSFQNKQMTDEGTMCREESPLPGTIGLVDLNITSKNTSSVSVIHVFIAFEGWNAPWEREGGKPIPLNAKKTVAKIASSVQRNFKQQGTKKNERLQVVAYATDTDDDVKELAEKFIKKNLSKDSSGHQTGKLIIYGYSWGGDTAVELSKDIKRKGHLVHLLVTVDAAMGFFNGPAVRDRNIPSNVKTNLNYYTTTPKSRIGSRGLPNWADDKSKTKVLNIKLSGPSHATMDEHTADEVVGKIVKCLIGQN